MADQWLSIVEYARTHAISDMTIRRRIKTGRIKAVLRDGKYYIPVGANGEIIEEPIETPKAAATAHAPAPGQASRGMRSPPPMSAYADEDTDMNYQTPPPPRAPSSGASFKALPQSLSQSMLRSEQSVVDTNALLQFCEKSLTRINSIERHLQDSYHARIQALEAQLRLKDATIAQLRQQAEDLQMLVKLMEKR